MKNLRSVLSVLSVLAVLLLATPARAQQNGVKADVPFDFVVGNRAYPAGEYTLRAALNGSSVIRIENMNEVSAAFAQSNACTKGTPSRESKLVFHRMGGHYFLYQVWTAGNLTGREFPKGRIEVELAQNHEQPEVVIVAAVISR
jgi:hypothetical protein